MATAKVILNEGQLRKRIERMKAIKEEISVLEQEWSDLAPAVIDTMGVKGLRQYDDLRAIVLRNLNRGISWKKEASFLAHKLYPTTAEFRKYLVSLVRRNPKKPGKPFLKLFTIKTEEADA